MDEMTNYTNMLRMNEKVCEEKRILAIDTIRRMVRDNEQITICELTKQTGLSRSIFLQKCRGKHGIKCCPQNATGQDSFQ